MLIPGSEKGIGDTARGDEGGLTGAPGIVGGSKRGGVEIGDDGRLAPGSEKGIGETTRDTTAGFLGDAGIIGATKRGGVEIGDEGRLAPGSEKGIGETDRDEPGRTALNGAAGTPGGVKRGGVTIEIGEVCNCGAHVIGSAPNIGTGGSFLGDAERLKSIARVGPLDLGDNLVGSPGTSLVPFGRSGVV